jgi:hypothetical protein
MTDPGDGTGVRGAVWTVGHGGLPPRLAALLGRVPPPPELRPDVSLEQLTPIVISEIIAPQKTML